MTQDTKLLIERLRDYAATGYRRWQGIEAVFIEAADALETQAARIGEAEKALAPFARVAAAFDYWSEEAMPDFCYPVLGTNVELAREDCPAAIGHLNEGDFRAASRFLSGEGVG